MAVRLSFQRSGAARARVLLPSTCLAVLMASTPAAASTLDKEGRLVFAPDAIATIGFESFSNAHGYDAQWVTWTTDTSGDYVLAGTAVTAADFGAAIVTGSEAIEGHAALRLGASTPHLGLAILGNGLFKTVGDRRIT